MDVTENIWNKYERKSIDQKTLREMLRLAGSTPREESYNIPQSLRDFKDLVVSTTSTTTKQDLVYLLRTFNSNYLTRKNVEKYFAMGDKFSEDEMKVLCRLLPFDSKNTVSIEEFVDFLFE